MKWFKHDSGANMDGKLQEVLLDYGLEGYGLYWYCLELIVNKIDVDNLTFELEHDSRIIARNTGSSVQRVTEMMTRFIDLGLFQNIEGKITCLKLLNRLDKSMTSNARMRGLIESAKKSHDPIMIKPDSVMQDKIRREEKRIEEITIKKISKDLSSNNDDIEFLQNIANHWNEIMITQPRIDLFAKTKITKTRVSAIKKITKDYPEYKDHEYFEGHFRQLATREDFKWQRENKQISFDQATNLTKFARNLDTMRMDDSKPRSTGQPAKPGMYEQTMNIEDF